MLRYLWIESYKNIRSTGFNFDPTLEAVYLPKSGKLTIKDNAENLLPEDFFGERVTLLTGIIGENGAGKSSVVDFIRSVLTNPAPDDATSIPPFLFIFGNSIIHSASIKVKLNQQTPIGYKIYNYEKDKSARSKWPIEAQKHAYIYYSNFWENTFIYPRPGLIDVSTNYLFEREFLDSNSQNIQITSPLTTYRTNNFLDEIKVISFLKNHSLKLSPFETPKYLILDIKDPSEVLEIGSFTKAFKKQFDQSKLTILINALNKQVTTASHKSAIEEFIARFILVRFHLLIRKFANEFSQFSKEELRNIVQLQLDTPLQISTELTNLINIIKDFIIFFRNLVDKKMVTPLLSITSGDEKVQRKVELNIENIEKGLAEEIFFKLAQADDNAQTFDVHWQGLSSGQAAYLRLYARLYKAFEHAKSLNTIHNKDIKSITILIDEGETGFHPQWQKKYIAIALEFLNSIFQGYKLQLIICSNSAFIASDIPRSNLLLLRRSKKVENTCEIVRWEDGETFAANIHALLTHSFFLQEGLMGDFSKAKLNELIEYLREPNNSKKEKVSNNSYSKTRQMRVILDIIGEPVIKMKLTDMWNAKFGVVEEIESLKKRIQELESQK